MTYPFLVQPWSLLKTQPGRFLSVLLATQTVITSMHTVGRVRLGRTCQEKPLCMKLMACCIMNMLTALKVTCCETKALQGLYSMCFLVLVSLIPKASHCLAVCACMCAHFVCLPWTCPISCLPRPPRGCRTGAPSDASEEC